MVFVLATVGLCFLLLLLSALWWMRLRDLCKLPDGRDWWWGKLGLALVGRALLSKVLVQYLLMGRVALTSGDFLAWSDVARWSGGCLVRLVVTSRRVYAKGDLPRMLLPVPSPRQGPADPHLHRRPSDTSRSLGSTSCWATALFFWVLVPARFCLTLQDKFMFAPGFPVLWKSCNQISLAFKVRFPGDSQSLCQIPRLGSLTWCSKPSQQWGNFSVIIVLQIVGHPPSGYRIWFYRDFNPPAVSL